MKHFLLSFIGSLFPFLAWAELVWKSDLPFPFEVKIQFNTHLLALDEQLEVEAIFHYPLSYQLESQDLIDSLVWSSNPFVPSVVLEEHQIFSSVAQTHQVLHLKAILYPMKEGELALSFLTIFFKSLEKPENSVYIETPVFLVQVLPPSLDPSLLQLPPLASLETQFPLGLTEKNRQLFIENPVEREQQKEYNQWVWKKSHLPWVLLFFIFFLGGITIVLYWNWKRLFPPSPPLPWDPKQQAEAALNALEKTKKTSAAIKKYYQDLVTILHHVLQERGVFVKGKTTIELVRSLSFLPPKMTEEIFVFLNTTDRIKFATEEASSDHLSLDHAQLLKIIDLLHHC